MPAASHSRWCGVISLATNWRKLSRNRSCSSVKIVRCIGCHRTWAPGATSTSAGTVRSMRFTAEHDLFRKTLRELFAREITPHLDEWEADGIFPAHELFPKLGAAGMLGLEYDEADGGQGADHSFTVVLGEELGRIPANGVPMAITVQTDMATPSLARFGSRRAEGAVPGAGLPRRDGGGHRGHRAGRRKRRRRASNSGRPRRRRVDHQRLEALHHERHASRLAVPPGSHVRRRWLPGHEPDRRPDRRAGLRGEPQAGQARQPQLGHRRVVVHRHARAGRQHDRRDRTRLPTADAAVPERADDRLLRRLGSDGVGPRTDGGLPEGASGVRRAADRATSTCSTGWPSWPPRSRRCAR